MSGASHPTNPPVIFGEVLFDCFAGGPRVLGGAPFNVAWHLQALGLEPVFISRVGADALGDEVLERMRAWGLATDGVQIDPAHATGEVQVRIRAGDPTYDIVPDRAYDRIAAAALPDVQPALIYHGTLALRNPVSAAALDRLVAESGAPVFLDVNLRPPWWDLAATRRLLDQASWVKLNHVELRTLGGAAGTLRDCAQALIERHQLAELIVTRGADGAFRLDRHGACSETPPQRPGPVVDTVGAGDAFTAVCIAGKLLQWAPEVVLGRAQQLAGLIVTRRGALLTDPREYESLRRAWRLS